MNKPFHVIREGIVLECRPEPEGGYTVTVPSLPGCLTYGETFEEAMTMIDDAIAGWLAVDERGRVPLFQCIAENCQWALSRISSDKLESPSMSFSNICREVHGVGH